MADGEGQVWSKADGVGRVAGRLGLGLGQCGRLRWHWAGRGWQRGCEKGGGGREAGAGGRRWRRTSRWAAWGRAGARRGEAMRWPVNRSTRPGAWTMERWLDCALVAHKARPSRWTVWTGCDGTGRGRAGAGRAGAGLEPSSGDCSEPVPDGTQTSRPHEGAFKRVTGWGGWAGGECGRAGAHARVCIYVLCVGVAVCRGTTARGRSHISRLPTARGPPRWTSSRLPGYLEVAYLVPRAVAHPTT